MKVCPWTLIRAGDKQKGIRQLECAYASEPDASHVMQLGVAYLWTEEYRKARRHFLRAIKECQVAEDFYGMAGTASWCMGDPHAAVTDWRDGLSAEWTDWAGGIELPLLLFFAAVVEPNVYSEADARRLLSEKLSSPLAVTWPAPLADLLLARIDLETMEGRYYRVNQTVESFSRWQTQFYVALLDYARGNVARYTALMKATAVTSDDDFDPTKPEYLGKLWYAEIFLARYEAATRC